MHNSRLIEGLRRMAMLRYLQGEERSRKSYEHVMECVQKLTYEIRNSYDAKHSLTDIGEKTSHVIDEILSTTDPMKTGIVELDSLLITNPLLFEKVAYMSLFSTVQGIGPHRASELYEQGYRSLDQLGNSGRKREDHTFEYTEELKKRILRHKIDIFKQTIEYFIQGYGINFIICGSYRRELETSKDIDIVFYGENVSYKGRELVHAMQHAGIILKVLSLGNDSFQGIAYLDEENKAVRVDFCFVNNPSELPYYLLYFTGSAQFNINMKTHARHYGFLLGNKEMLYDGVHIYVNNEEDIFRTLGLKWVPPKERIDKLTYL